MAPPLPLALLAERWNSLTLRVPVPLSSPLSIAPPVRPSSVGRQRRAGHRQSPATVVAAVDGPAVVGAGAVPRKIELVTVNGTRAAVVAAVDGPAVGCWRNPP